jgi:uncharacterized oxidoreductase
MAAGGKIYAAKMAGRPLAEGLCVDAQGRPTTNPDDYFNGGAILPMAGPKGYGMALMCEILAGALTGGETLHAAAPTIGIYNNMLSIIIDPARLGASTFGPQMEAFIDWVRASPAAPGFDRVRIAGEPELEMRARRAKGIPIDVNTWRDMQAAAATVGMAAAEVAAFAALARTE